MIDIRPMDEDYIMLGCLHDGPVDTSTWRPDWDLDRRGLPPHPWTDETIRDLASEHPAISHGGCEEHAAATREFMLEMI